MNQKKNWLSLGLMLALMALTGFFLLRNQPVSSLMDVLRRIDPVYVLMGLGLMVVFVGCEAMCTRLILRRLGHSVPYRRCMGYSFTGFYFSSITPSSTGGQPAQVYYMARDGVPAAHGTLDMLLITVCYQAATLIFGVGSFLVYPRILTVLGGGWRLLLVYGIVSTVALTAAVLTVMFAPRAAGRIAGGCLSLLARVHIVKDRAGMQEKLDAQMAEYRRGADCLKSYPRLVPALLGLSLTQLLALYLVPFVVYRAFGLSGSSAVQMVAVQALLTVAVSTLPLPGAVGPSEGGFVKVFTLFFGAGLVTPAMLVSRGISFYAFLLLSAGETVAVHLRSGKRAKARALGLPAPRRAAAPLG